MKTAYNAIFNDFASSFTSTSLACIINTCTSLQKDKDYLDDQIEIPREKKRRRFGQPMDKLRLDKEFIENQER